uniref:Glutamate synthase n=1 Tax=Soboliphyme baturini TaxID=241478 RepID=A0A183ISR9_9BILA
LHDLFYQVFPKEYKKILEDEKKLARSTSISITNVDQFSDIVEGEDRYPEDILQDTPADTMLQSEGFDSDESEGFMDEPVALDSLVSPFSLADVDIENLVPNKLLHRHTENALDKTRGFIKYPRHKVNYRKPDVRLNDFDEVYNFPEIRGSLKMQAARCMDCGVPFCQGNTGCPLGNIIPRWNDLVFKNNWREALIQLLQTNNFPEFTGRVCPAPCEAACCLAISEDPVTIKNIECSIIEYAFEKDYIKPEPPAFRTGKRIAVVGSGPAGLAAAAQLNKVGHTVLVYERNNRVGGLLQYGIPSMKLSKKVIGRRVTLMEQEGVRFVTDVEVGKDISAKLLMQENDAVLLAIGSTRPRDLPIPGRELKGIHFAMEFLETFQKFQGGYYKEFDEVSAKDRAVVIVGGGDTATDCLSTALRQGAKSVLMFEILPLPPQQRSEQNPWPEWPVVFRIDYGHDEFKTLYKKDPRVFATSAKVRDLRKMNMTVRI